MIVPVAANCAAVGRGPNERLTNHVLALAGTSSGNYPGFVAKYSRRIGELDTYSDSTAIVGCFGSRTINRKPQARSPSVTLTMDVT